MDSSSQSRLNPLRALPVAFALVLNVVVGPLGPVVSQLAPDRVMGYVGDATTFELDGNAIHNIGHDWDQVYADRNGPPYPNSGAISQAFKVDGLDAGDDILTGGSTKDVHDISSWAWKIGKVQDKDDIENAFAAAYTAANGDTVGYFGLDRFSNRGDATAGFWFFKNGIAKNANGTFSGVHAEGDILVVLDFSNGGATASAKVYTWHNGGLSASIATGGNCDASAQAVCAIANTGNAASPWPYTPKFGTANVFPANALYEAGIDLSVLHLDTGCFASFLAETRSSNSTTSTLSDFTLGQFSFCEKPSLTTQVSKSSGDVGDNFSDTATLSGTKGGVTGTVAFSVCGPTQSAQPCTSGGTSAGTIAIVNGQATSNTLQAPAPRY
jgi:hypothetical protein